MVEIDYVLKGIQMFNHMNRFVDKIKIIKSIFWGNPNNYKSIYNRKEIEQFFNMLNKVSNSYLQVHMIKPNTLIDSKDINFNKLDLYNQFNNIDIKEKIYFFKQIKSYTQNYNNAYYITLNDNVKINGEIIKIQPFIISVWYLGSELRVGCFYNPEEISKVIEEKGFKNKITNSLNIFENLKYKEKSGSSIRNNFVLEEKKISLIEGKILENQEFLDFFSSTFGIYVTSIFKYYFEETRKK